MSLLTALSETRQRQRIAEDLARPGSTGDSAVFGSHESSRRVKNAPYLGQPARSCPANDRRSRRQRPDRPRHPQQAGLRRSPLGTRSGRSLGWEAALSRCNIEHPQDRVDSNKRPVRDSGRSVPQGRTSPAPNIHDDRAGSQVQRLHGKTVRGVLSIFAGVPLGRLSVPHTHRLDCENPGPAAALRAGLRQAEATQIGLWTSLYAHSRSTAMMRPVAAPTMLSMRSVRRSSRSLRSALVARCS